MSGLDEQSPPAGATAEGSADAMGAMAKPHYAEIHETGNSHAVPPIAVMRILSRHDRNQLAGFIAVALDLLDLLNGDEDMEPETIEADGDELDGNFAEDDGAASNSMYGNGPGCIYSDDDNEHDGRESEHVL